AAEILQHDFALLFRPLGADGTAGGEGEQGGDHGSFHGRNLSVNNPTWQAGEDCGWSALCPTRGFRRCPSQRLGDIAPPRAVGLRSPPDGFSALLAAMRLYLVLALLLTALVRAQPATGVISVVILRPARIFDGESGELTPGVVVVENDRIKAVSRDATAVPAGAKVIELPGLTLLPGLIDAHSHILLHPYSETPWNDQVAHESLALRVARATNHLRATLLAGFTTLRDLGTEGAGYADVGLKEAVER